MTWVAEFPEIGEPEYAEPLFQAARAFGDAHGRPRRSLRPPHS